jgi:AraC-like DNA-binding protein
MKQSVDSLKEAVRAYASHHANRDGLALTPVPGLQMKCVASPGGDLHAICRPMVCLVLQGAKRMMVGSEDRAFTSGQSVIVIANAPVVSRIVQASRSEPYLAIAVELEITILRDVAALLGSVVAKRPSEPHQLFAEDTDAAALDCASRLMGLLDRPEATPLLCPGIMGELHYWLLSGRHGAALRSLADSDSHANRLAEAIAILRAQYRSRLSVEGLAAATGMSLTAFHKHFKRITSLTPRQFQKRLRLIEARRLMLDEGASASSAAFEVGYESAPQFTREYGRLFQASPRRDILRARSCRIGEQSGNLPATHETTFLPHSAAPESSDQPQ